VIFDLPPPLIDVPMGLGGVDIKVHPVLGGLALRHPLKKQPRPRLLRVHDRRHRIPSLARETDPLGELLPGSEAGRWLLQLVIQASAQNSASRPGFAASKVTWKPIDIAFAFRCLRMLRSVHLSNDTLRAKALRA
jgi:hypothetical protein